MMMVMMMVRMVIIIVVLASVYIVLLVQIRPIVFRTEDKGRDNKNVLDIHHRRMCTINYPAGDKEE